eukprot:3985101-Pleurochrysis_carterae.AAC.1
MDFYVWGPLIPSAPLRAYYHVCTFPSVLIMSIFSTLPIHDPYWVEGIIGPCYYDSFRNASFYTHSHLIIIFDACGLDNDIYLLLFGDQARTSTYSTGVAEMALIR